MVTYFALPAKLAVYTRSMLWQVGRVLTPAIGALEADAIREEWADVLSRLDSDEAKHIVIDLEALGYFGSIVLELVVVLWKRLSARGGRLAFCNVSTVGLEILQAAKFDKIWPIASSRQEAIEAVRQ